VLPPQKKKKERRGRGRKDKNSLEKKCADTFQLVLCFTHAPLSSSITTFSTTNILHKY
jgi:hypothetical protein